MQTHVAPASPTVVQPAVVVGKGKGMTFAEATPNILVSSTAISLATVGFTYPQLNTVSKGLIPRPTPASMTAVLAKTMPFQIVVKAAQFALMRSVRKALDEANPSTPALNTMVAYGSTAVPFQSALYNRCISDIYKYHGVSPPSARAAGVVENAKVFFWRTVYPGLAWCFLRECCATGGGMVLGPIIAPTVKDQLPENTNPIVVRTVSGVVAGSFTALLTMWLHNICLTAGGMAEMGERPTTVACFRRAVHNLGVSMFYKNYSRRMFVIATASGSLNAFPVCD